MEPHDQPDDAELLRRLRGGDGDALRELMARYDRLVRYAIFRVCRRECQRDGAVLDSRSSETWSGFVESIRRREAALPKNVKTYLLQIARNKCTDALRRTGEPGVELDDMNTLPGPPENNLEILIRAEEVLALRGCMQDLTPDEQMICNQIDLILDGRWTRAGEALGLPESTLRTRWPGIISKLRACLRGKTGKTLAPGGSGPDS